MSIVYDYLKQIQDKKEPAKAVAPENSEPPKKRSTVLLMVGLALLACVGVGLAVYVFAPRAVKPIVRLYHSSKKDALNEVSSEVPMMRSSESAYVLEGIIYNPSQPFAIINGKMLETKGRIGDFEVTKIAPDFVTLWNTKDNTSRTIHL